jgi:hypothetical protein
VSGSLALALAPSEPDLADRSEPVPHGGQVAPSRRSGRTCWSRKGHRVDRIRGAVGRVPGIDHHAIGMRGQAAEHRCGDSIAVLLRSRTLGQIREPFLQSDPSPRQQRVQATTAPGAMVGCPDGAAAARGWRPGPPRRPGYGHHGLDGTELLALPRARDMSDCTKPARAARPSGALRSAGRRILIAAA